MCEKICSNKYVDLNVDSKALTIFFREENLSSGKEDQHLKIVLVVSEQPSSRVFRNCTNFVIRYSDDLNSFICMSKCSIPIHLNKSNSHEIEFRSIKPGLIITSIFWKILL